MLARRRLEGDYFTVHACGKMCTPDGDISILDALHNGGAMPLHCLCVHSHNLCQCVERHIPNVVVPAHDTDRLLSMSKCTCGKSCMQRSVLQDLLKAFDA
jgi:hypothetical protein